MVQANNVPSAVKHIEEVMGKTMIDYVIVAIQETQIMDVFEHNSPKLNQDTHSDDVPEYETQEQNNQTTTE